MFLSLYILFVLVPICGLTAIFLCLLVFFTATEAGVILLISIVGAILYFWAISIRDKWRDKRNKIEQQRLNRKIDAMREKKRTERVRFYKEKLNEHS